MKTTDHSFCSILLFLSESKFLGMEILLRNCVVHEDFTSAEGYKVNDLRTVEVLVAYFFVRKLLAAGFQMSVHTRQWSRNSSKM